MPGAELEAQILPSEEEALLDFDRGSNTFSFLTGGAIKAGHREGERHKTVGTRGNISYTYSFSDGELNSLAFNRSTGHLMWVKNGGIFPDSAYLVYFHCH